MKTVNCGECANRDWSKLKMKCTLGHKPRFYVPTIYQILQGSTDWGYKIKCPDYIEDQRLKKIK